MWVRCVSASARVTTLRDRAMADEPRVQELLDEILNSERTPEEVCEDCPALLPEVRNRWDQLRVIKAEVEALFPAPGSDTGPESLTPCYQAAGLPCIPGYEV